MKETDLYLPVKKIFEDLEYNVQGEVNNIDVIASKEDEMVIIELKTSYNLKLILQAVERQRISQQVYVAIPRPVFKKRLSKTLKEKEHLLRRLGLGLIYVALDVNCPYAQIVFDPKPFNLNLSKSKIRKNQVIKELSERNGDYNIGGSKGKLVTAYREKALIVVNLLMINGEMSVKDLREQSGNEKIQAILTNNHYGWYERIRKGIYRLSDQGVQAFETYKDVIINLQ